MSSIPLPAESSVAPVTPRLKRSGGNDHHDKPRIRGELVASTLICHIGALAAPWTFSWSGAAFVPLLWWMTGGLGICLGYHRQLTHVSFKTYRGIRYALIVLGCMANQGAPITWAGTHRLHHRHADDHDDPHSPVVENFFWAHVFWAFFYEHAGSRRAAKDLERDTFIRILDRYSYVPTIILAIVLFLIGGWSWVVWGVFVRTVAVLHGTFLVNSAAHTWGYRNFETDDGSRNNWWVSLITFGEGWHNNHHAYQRSAAHGLKWWEFDSTYLTICAMEKLGLAWDVKRPPAAVLDDLHSPISRGPAGATPAAAG